MNTNIRIRKLKNKAHFQSRVYHCNRPYSLDKQDFINIIDKVNPDIHKKSELSIEKPSSDFDSNEFKSYIDKLKKHIRVYSIFSFHIE